MTLTFKQIPLSQINLEGTKANPNFEANLESYLEKLKNRSSQDEKPTKLQILCKNFYRIRV